MIERHPSLRVTPVEIGDPIRWATTPSGALEGRTDARGCWYIVERLDDVWLAEQLSFVLGHGGERESRRRLRHCLDVETAMAACQDAEHIRAWGALSETARRMLLGLERPAVPPMPVAEA